MQATLGFTKLIVENLDVAERFYSATFGFRCTRRTPPDQPTFGKEERVMAPFVDGENGILILMRYVDRPCPAPGSCVIGFVVGDVAATCAAAVAHGGRVLIALEPEASGGRRAGLLKDPAGHLLEYVERQ